MLITHKTFRAVAMSGALLLPAAAVAQEAGPPRSAASSIENPISGLTSAVEVGVAPQSDDSFIFGKYTGTTNQGTFGVGNLLVRRRDKWDSGGTRYGEVLGTKLGLTSREMSAKYGQQGLWGVSVFYNQLPFYQSDSAWTIFGNAGSASLVLPVNIPKNTTAAIGSQLTPYLSPQNFNLDRKTVGGGFTFQPTGAWQVTSNISHEHKEGLKEQSLSVNVRTDPAFFPEPVNYDTDTLEASAAYNQQAVQLQLGYNFSNFANKYDAVLIPSPFVGAAQQSVGAISQWALPASSMAHDFNFASAYKVTQTTRLNVNLGTGLQLQNEPLLPYTRNTNFVTGAVPRSSLNGKVQTYLAQFKATTQPVRKLDLSASYTYDKRANMTPRDPYMSLQEPEWVQTLMWNVPYGFTNQSAKADAGYRFWKGNKLAVGYEHKEMDRTFAEVTNQKENTARVRLSQDLGFGTSYVSYLHGTRTGSPYDPLAFDVAIGNLSSPPPLLPYQNNGNYAGYLLEPNYYLFRRFFEADRTRSEVKAGSNFDIAQSLSIEVFGRRTNDDYTKSQYGITAADSWSADADLAYTIEKAIELHGFYTFESIASNQTSLGSTGIVNNIPTDQWTFHNNYRDRVHSVGLGATWDVIDDVLKVGPRAEIILASTDIDVISGPGAGTSAQWVSKPVPAISSTSRAIKFFSEYTFRPNTILRVVYDFEHLNLKDPALDSGPLPTVTPTSLAGVTGASTYGWLVGGDTNGSYTIHLITASVIWRF